MTVFYTINIALEKILSPVDTIYLNNQLEKLKTKLPTNTFLNKMDEYSTLIKDKSKVTININSKQS